MLRYYVRRSQGEEFEEVKSPRGDSVWVCGENTTKEDIAQLAADGKLNANILADVRDSGELPRIEYDDGMEYVFLRSPELSKKGAVTSSPLVAVVGKNSFATLFHGPIALPIASVNAAAAGKTKHNTALLLSTLASLIASYEAVIQHTAQAIQDTGKRLRTHDVTNNDFIHFVTVEQNLNEYHMNLDGMLSVAQRLYDNAHNFFHDDELEAIADLSLHIKQLLVTVDTSSKRIESIRSAYSTIANNNLNQRMKTLTVLTLLVALPNVVYGMYGMNVILPFADQPWAYAAIVGFTVVLVLAVYMLAKRTKLF